MMIGNANKPLTERQKNIITGIALLVVIAAEMALIAEFTKLFNY